MKNRKLFQHLSQIPTKDFHHFHQFAQSPFLKISKEALLILKAALPFHPKFEISEEQLIAKAKKEGKIAAHRLNFYLHELSKILEKWLRWQEVEKDEILKQKLTVQAYRARFGEQEFFKSSEHLINLIEEKMPQNPDAFLEKHLAFSGVFYHNQTPKFKVEVDSLKAMEKNLDSFYQGVKLRLFCQKMSRNAFLKTVLDLEGQKEWLALAEQYQGIPFFKLHFNLLNYQIKPDELFLEILIADFYELNKNLDRLERSIYSSLIISKLAPQSSKGNVKMQQLQFQLMQYCLAQDLVIFDGEVRAVWFNNFVLTACLLKEFKVAKSFVKKYGKHLNETSRKDFLQLMNCTILYYQGKLKEVEIQLDQLKFKHSGLKIRVKNLQAKCLYELFEKEESYRNLVQHNLLNFKRFVEKQKDLKEHRKQEYFNFIFVLRKMVLHFYKRKYQQKMIKIELLSLVRDEKNSLISRLWLKEKLENWA